jgi:hypothetical protein
MGGYLKSKSEFLPKEKLWAIVESFRAKYWPSNKLPVDVDLVAELAGLEIIPKKDLFLI